MRRRQRNPCKDEPFSIKTGGVTDVHGVGSACRPKNLKVPTDEAVRNVLGHKATTMEARRRVGTSRGKRSRTDDRGDNERTGTACLKTIKQADTPGRTMPLVPRADKSLTELGMILSLTQDSPSIGSSKALDCMSPQDRNRAVAKSLSCAIGPRNEGALTKPKAIPTESNGDDEESMATTSEKCSHQPQGTKGPDNEPQLGLIHAITMCGPLGEWEGVKAVFDPGCYYSLLDPAVASDLGLTLLPLSRGVQETMKTHNTALKHLRGTRPRYFAQGVRVRSSKIGLPLSSVSVLVAPLKTDDVNAVIGAALADHLSSMSIGSGNRGEGDAGTICASIHNPVPQLSFQSDGEIPLPPVESLPSVCQVVSGFDTQWPPSSMDGCPGTMASVADGTFADIGQMDSFTLQQVFGQEQINYRGWEYSGFPSNGLDPTGVGGDGCLPLLDQMGAWQPSPQDGGLWPEAGVVYPFLDLTETPGSQ